MDHTFTDHDVLLVKLAEGLQPERDLDLEGGSGANAVWMAGDDSGRAYFPVRAKIAGSNWAGTVGSHFPLNHIWKSRLLLA